MLFNQDTDANPVDTFDLNPPETDVTVHSAVSTAELPTTATTDLPYVIRLEHEPLTTCWPGRFVTALCGPQCEKTYLREFANNTGPGQPAHLRSLISAFVICFLESIISKLASSEISLF